MIPYIDRGFSSSFSDSFREGIAFNKQSQMMQQQYLNQRSLQEQEDEARRNLAIMEMTHREDLQNDRIAAEESMAEAERQGRWKESQLEGLIELVRLGDEVAANKIAAVSRGGTSAGNSIGIGSGGAPIGPMALGTGGLTHVMNDVSGYIGADFVPALLDYGRENPNIYNVGVNKGKRVGTPVGRTLQFVKGGMSDRIGDPTSYDPEAAVRLTHMATQRDNEKGAIITMFDNSDKLKRFIHEVPRAEVVSWKNSSGDLLHTWTVTEEEGAAIAREIGATGRQMKNGNWIYNENNSDIRDWAPILAAGSVIIENFGNQTGVSMVNRSGGNPLAVASARRTHLYGKNIRDQVYSEIDDGLFKGAKHSKDFLILARRNQADYTYFMDQPTEALIPNAVNTFANFTNLDFDPNIIQDPKTGLVYPMLSADQIESMNPAQLGRATLRGSSSNPWGLINTAYDKEWEYGRAHLMNRINAIGGFGLPRIEPPQQRMSKQTRELKRSFKRFAQGFYAGRPSTMGSPALGIGPFMKGAAPPPPIDWEEKYRSQMLIMMDMMERLGIDWK